MDNLNQIITEVAIVLKSDKSLNPLIEKYGEDKVSEAMVFIAYEEKEILELEEDYYEESNNN